MKQQTRNFYTKAVLTVILAERRDFILKKKLGYSEHGKNMCIFESRKKKYDY